MTFIRVAPDGKSLADYSLQTKARCSDHRRRLVGIARRGQRLTSVAPDGSFSHSSPSTAGRIRIGRRRVRATFKTTFQGAFADSGRRVQGTLAMRVVTRSVRCNSSVPFLLYRDGTPGAPFVAADFATGRYIVAGEVEGSMTVFVPGRYIHSTHLRHASICRHGHLVARTGQGNLGWPLRKGFRVKIPGHERRGSFRFRERAILRLRFFKAADGSFNAIGTLRSTTAVYNHGRRIDTCRGNSVVTARYDGRGPLNDTF